MEERGGERGGEVEAVEAVVGVIAQDEGAPFRELGVARQEGGLEGVEGGEGVRGGEGEGVAVGGWGRGTVGGGCGGGGGRARGCEG